MSIRIASVFLSLLAHGTVLLYPGSFTPPDRPAPAASGKSLRLAFDRAENPQQTANSSYPREPAAVAIPAPTTTRYEPVPEPVVSAITSGRAKPLQQGSANQSPAAPARPEKSPAVAVSKQREKPVAPPVNVPVPPTLPEPQPADEPSKRQVADAAPSAGPSRQRTALEVSRGSTDALREIELSYENALVAAIERHKRYPLRARKKGYEGEVLVLFIVRRDGTISEIEIGSSSRWGILDRAAARAVRDLGYFKPIPPQLGRDQWAFQVPIRFVMH